MRSSGKPVVRGVAVWSFGFFFSHIMKIERRRRNHSEILVAVCERASACVYYVERVYISTCRFFFSFLFFFPFFFLLSSHLGRAPLCPKRARWFQVSWHFSLFFLNSQEPRWLGNKAFSPGQQGQNGRFRDLSCTKIKTHTGPPNQRLSHVRLDRCVV